MKELEEARIKVLAMLVGEPESDRWIEWIHEGSLPAETSAKKTLNTTLSAISKHCAKCMNLNNCRFLKSKMPELPLHEKCHCKVKDIPRPVAGTTAFAECPIEKITKYVFINKAKKRFFESNGYDIMDSERMQAEYERQAVEKYAKGNYELGALDDFGQRITIFIELPRRVGDYSEPLRFKTGWIVYPYGKIQLATPATNLSSK